MIVKILREVDALFELTTLDRSDFYQLPPESECRYEVLTSSNGLSAMCGSAHFPSQCEWINEEGGGFWCGVILEGAVAIEIGDSEANYLKENECFIWAEENSLPMKHIIPEAQRLSTIFIRVPHELAENCDFPEHLYRPTNTDVKNSHGILNFYKSVTSGKVLSTANEITTCDYEGPFRAFYLHAKYLEFLVELRKQLVGENTGEQSIENRRISYAERLLKARNILIDEIQTPPTLEELADRVAMCKSALTAGFRNSFGLSVTEFSQERRLTFAYNQLKNNRMNVSQAAYSVGYSRAYFSTLFRQRYGVSPSDVFKTPVLELIN